MKEAKLGAGFAVTLTRTFKGPAVLVFDCFTQADHFARWWGPAGCKNEIHVFDARPGGEISLRMAGPGFDHVMGGEFVELERPGRLVFYTKAFPDENGAWGIVNRNTVTLTESGGVTAMTLQTLVEHVSEEIAPALGGMEIGTRQSLDRLQVLADGLV